MTADSPHYINILLEESPVSPHLIKHLPNVAASASTDAREKRCGLSSLYSSLLFRLRRPLATLPCDITLWHHRPITTEATASVPQLRINQLQHPAGRDAPYYHPRGFQPWRHLRGLSSSFCLWPSWLRNAISKVRRRMFSLCSKVFFISFLLHFIPPFI